MNRFICLLSLFFLSLAFDCKAESQSSEESCLELEDKIYSASECYTIIKKIGEGAFGKVYEVESSKGERFALKSIKQEPDLSLGIYEDAEREFLRGQLLDHPNIIRSYDFFTYNHPSGIASKNIVLQLVRGMTLHLRPRKSLSLEQAVVAVSQFSNAIHYALTLNLLHLDLHEGNVMMSDRSEVMIVDLASFFTYEEIFSYLMASSSRESLDSYAEESTKLLGNAQINLDQNTVPTEREEKIKIFFEQNPVLFSRLKKICQNEPKMMSHRLEFRPNQSNDGESDLSDSQTGLSVAIFEAYYFERLTDVCMCLLSKSDMAREDKINRQIEIKKIALNYHEDIEDEQPMPIHFYVDQLLQVF